MTRGGEIGPPGPPGPTGPQGQQGIQGPPNTWKANQAYEAGARVIAPSGNVATAKRASQSWVYLERDWVEVGKEAADQAQLALSGWVPPAPGTSAATAVLPDGGGHRFFERFAKAAAFANPDVVPIAIWAATVGSVKDAVVDLNAGANFYLGLYGRTPALDTLVRLGGRMKAALQVDNPEDTSGNNQGWPDAIAGGHPAGEHVIGWILLDERDQHGTIDSQIELIKGLHATLPADDGRFRYTNFGLNFQFFENDVENARFADVADWISVDSYWYTSPAFETNGWPAKMMYRFGDVPRSDTPLDFATQVVLGVNYKYNVNIVRRAFTTGGRSAPTVTFIEDGHPMEDPAPTITLPQIRAATWHSLIAGAQAVFYFNHSFGGTLSNYVNRTDPGVQATLASLNHRIQLLARVIHAPSIQGMLTTSGDRVHTSVRMVGGQIYILSGNAQATAATVTFTLPAGTTGYATPIHEGRAGIALTGGAFTDTFTDETSIHIYRIDTAQVTDPEPAPPQQIAAFDAFGAARQTTNIAGTAPDYPATARWSTPSDFYKGTIGINSDGDAYLAVNNQAYALLDLSSVSPYRTVSATISPRSPGSVYCGITFQQNATHTNGYLMTFDDTTRNAIITKPGPVELLRLPSPSPGQTVTVESLAGGVHNIYYDGRRRGTFTDTTCTGGYDGLYFQNTNANAGRISEFTVGAIPTVINTAAPTITGTPETGQVLTANPGTWAPSSSTYTYQWLRDNTPISGATGSTYTLVAADEGHQVAVQVTASATSYNPGTATSTAVPVTAPIVWQITDTFTRADSTTTLGTTETGAKAWAPTVGTWGILNGQAYPVEAWSGHVATIDLGTPDMMYEVRFATISQTGIHPRWTDVNNNILISAGGSITETVAGTSKAVTGVSAFANGDLVRVSLQGTTATLYKNNVQVRQWTTTVTTGTRAGLRGDGTTRFDDFKAKTN